MLWSTVVPELPGCTIWCLLWDVQGDLISRNPGHRGCSYVTNSRQWNGDRNGVHLSLPCLEPKIFCNILAHSLSFFLSPPLPQFCNSPFLPLFHTIIALVKDLHSAKAHMMMECTWTPETPNGEKLLRSPVRPHPSAWLSDTDRNKLSDLAKSLSHGSSLLGQLELGKMTLWFPTLAFYHPLSH